LSEHLRRCGHRRCRGAGCEHVASDVINHRGILLEIVTTGVIG
jgi:hypothetical protein